MSKKTVLVTAAGSGMGAAIARRLAKENYNVCILSSSGKGEALALDIGGFGFTGSNLNPEDLARFVELSLEKYGAIDALVNSAGHGPKGDIMEITDEQWHHGMDVYLMNVIRTVRLVTPHLLKRGGAIVNVSTYATFEPDPAFPTSGVFRAGLAAFSKLYADKYANKGIRINNILPGFIDSLPEKEQFKVRIPMERYGKVEEVADTAAFLLGDGAGYITGQNLRVDGGITKSV